MERRTEDDQEYHLSNKQLPTLDYQVTPNCRGQLATGKSRECHVQQNQP